MRIVQLSDVHLSSKNKTDLTNFYMDALVDDLRTFHDDKRIDIILLTGDLVDKGGNSLGSHPYALFEDLFIKPISEQLGLPKDKFLFIPGNHDINREFIDEENEFYLSQKLTKETANIKLEENLKGFARTNKRIENFKKFEQSFHRDNNRYIYSNNESLAIESYENNNVGFALINDSWRCSSKLEMSSHFIGTNQLFNAKRQFNEKGTKINIAVFHHPLTAINAGEAQEIENILKSQNFDIAFFGHSHEHKSEFILSSHGGYIAIQGRSAFNDVNEQLALYQTGYNIIDLNVSELEYTLYARKFIKSNGYRFDADTESIKDGRYRGSLKKQQGHVQLSSDITNFDNELPVGYSADVKRIVKLLIGRSLYPDPNIFVRELVQNSVDACERVKEKYTLKDPQIIVNVDTTENFFEISDQGDGMTKKILKEHFSVIGKSISQEFNEYSGNFNLISQFGIGFISVFMVAEKICISTKSEYEEQINFEITDVFDGFKYLPEEQAHFDQILTSGTTIRVYLKKNHHAITSLHVAKNYCRHIQNLSFYFNGVFQSSVENWNDQNGIFFYENENSKYKIKLVISNNFRSLTSSNCGFLINHNSIQIIPARFPYIIGGEINFRAKCIDFDLSRSNIIESSKSKDCRREISVALKILFREALEYRNKQLTPAIVDHLQYYLCNYEVNNEIMQQSYIDFYTKQELINLCVQYLEFDYKNWQQPLIHILLQLKKSNINYIYVYDGNFENEYQRVIVEYLYDQGHLVVKPRSFSIQFRDAQQTVNSLHVLQIVANTHNLSIININTLQPDAIYDMIVPRHDLPVNISTIIDAIESEQLIKIIIAKFNKNSKPLIKFNNHFYINYEHVAFQSIINSHKKTPVSAIAIYLNGLLGLGLKEVFTN